MSWHRHWLKSLAKQSSTVSNHNIHSIFLFSFSFSFSSSFFFFFVIWRGRRRRPTSRYRFFSSNFWAKEAFLLHPDFFFVFLHCFFLCLFFFCVFFGRREGERRSLRVRYPSSDFWARTSLPGGTLLHVLERDGFFRKSKARVPKHDDQSKEHYHEGANLDQSCRSERFIVGKCPMRYESIGSRKFDETIEASRKNLAPKCNVKMVIFGGRVQMTRRGRRRRLDMPASHDGDRWNCAYDSCRRLSVQI